MRAGVAAGPHCHPPLPPLQPLRSQPLSSLAAGYSAFSRDACRGGGRVVTGRTKLPRRVRSFWPGVRVLRRCRAVFTGTALWRRADGCILCPFRVTPLLLLSPAGDTSRRIPTRRGKRGGYRPEHLDLDTLYLFAGIAPCEPGAACCPDHRHSVDTLPAIAPAAHLPHARAAASARAGLDCHAGLQCPDQDRSFCFTIRGLT